MANTDSSKLAAPSPFGSAFISPSEFLKIYTYKPSSNLLLPEVSGGQTALPTNEPYSQQVKDQLDLAKGYFPIWQQMQQSAAKTAADSTRQQTSDIFPILNAGSAASTARALGASTKFLLTKEQTPTAQALRNQIAQGQILSAESGAAARDQAAAAQWLAAGQGPRQYSGTMFRMA